MSVILLILKIIGIVLLVLLVLLLFLIALVLFVPVRYRITGEAEDEISVHISVTWLLHLISWRGAYEKEAFDSCLRIFGIRVKGKPKSTPDESGVEEEEPEALEAKCEEEPKILEPKRAVEGGEEPEVLETKHKETPGALETKREKEPETLEIKSDREGEEEPKAGSQEKTGRHSAVVGQKIREVISKIQNFFSGIKRRFLAVKAGFPQIKEKISDIKSILVDETNKIVVAALFRELKYLLEHFKFRKIDTQLRFSLGDSATTGQVLGGLSMMPFLYQYQFRLYPDFEADEPYLRGTFDISGRVRGVHGLVSLIRLIWKKEVRTLIKKLINR